MAMQSIRNVFSIEATDKSKLKQLLINFKFNLSSTIFKLKSKVLENNAEWAKAIKDLDRFEYRLIERYVVIFLNLT